MEFHKFLFYVGDLDYWAFGYCSVGLPYLNQFSEDPKGGVPEARLTRTARLNLSTQTLGFVGRGLTLGFNPCARSKSFSVWLSLIHI